MKIKKHWLTQVTKVTSPNFDDRPIETDISLIVIHCISLPPNQFGGDYINQLFCNQLDPEEHPYFKKIHQLNVSSHLLIRRCGEVVQYVPFNKRAWHAGASEYNGRQKCNDFSIGIELEGTEETKYTPKQYQQLNEVIKVLLAFYPSLFHPHICGHCDIAPERKTDPGKRFDWSTIYPRFWRGYHEKKTTYHHRIKPPSHL